MAKKLIVIIIATIMLFGVFGLTACNFEGSLTDYKVTKSKELQDYADAKGESNYRETNWIILQGYVADGKSAIAEATTKSQVDTVVTTAKAAINEITMEMLYTLQEAYDQELLTVDDLRSIAYYYHNGLEWVDCGCGVEWAQRDCEHGTRFDRLKPTDFVPKSKKPEVLDERTINIIQDVGGCCAFVHTLGEEICFFDYYGTYNGFIAFGNSTGSRPYWGFVARPVFTMVAEIAFVWPDSFGGILIWQEN